MLGTLLTALAVGLVAPATANADAFVPQGLLDGAAKNPSTIAHVIVVAEPGISAGRLKNDVMKDANGRQIGSVRREYKLIDAVAADITGSELLYLAKRAGIHSITPNGAAKEDAALELWPFAVGADKLWGSGPSASSAPAIAIVDSGVQDGRLDFEGRLTDNVNLSSFRADRKDDYGHGTLVAGIAAGASPAYPGVATKARIMSIRVVDGNGRSLVSDVLAAADWIYENRIGKGIGVVNFSLRSEHANYGMHDPINLAVERLWNTGTVVVASAGNSGEGRMLYAPASNPFVITVGAVDVNGTADVADDFNAPWSSYGYTAEGFAKPELSAPGRRMVAPVPSTSTLATSFPTRIVAPGYMWMSGTSFSAPVVAGAAAQILARHPGWTPDQVKGALMVTARHLPAAAPMSTGIGEIDVAGAAAVTAPPNPNENLRAFLKSDPRSGLPYFDAPAWDAHVEANATWTSATWTSATWTSAARTDATWTSATWTSAAHADATWTSATWTSATWTSATWTSATWTSATWTSSATLE